MIGIRRVHHVLAPSFSTTRCADPFDQNKASPGGKEDAMHEGSPILYFPVPKAFVHASGRLTGMTFGRVRAEYGDNGRRRLVPTGEPDEFHPCDEVLIA